MKKHAHKNRRSQEFNVGDKVMVKLLPQDHKFLRGRDSCLLQKYKGPLTIVKKIGKMAYKVDPPHWWSRQLHHVFHVSMLKPFYEDTSDPQGAKSGDQDSNPKQVITASRKRHQEYLVKWQGYMEEENTWERVADLSAYNDKIKAYHMQKLTKASIALMGENVTGCPLHPPSTVPLRPSITAPTCPPNTRPCAFASSSSLAPMRPSSIAPACPTAMPPPPPSPVTASVPSFSASIAGHGARSHLFGRIASGAVHICGARSHLEISGSHLISHHSHRLHLNRHRDLKTNDGKMTEEELLIGASRDQLTSVFPLAKEWAGFACFVVNINPASKDQLILWSKSPSSQF
ncbi:hypothetical protein RJ640_001172 [Escallonia rubra]|uniref:Chromo domain-containing protein n=1 Tax=Escallonia rubra TaxID=112253 RepID=A0AA88QWX7_9ASTE|nr:hypothetical protein RJ640_001172 [Escallonia rubra]